MREALDCWTLSYTPGKIRLMKAATRVTSKGQVVIPKPVREQLRWVSGTQIAVEIMGDGAVRLTPLAAEDSIDILFGCLQDLPGDPVAALEAEHRAEIEADERRQRRGR
jgi:AbrB family looped-hinge helix DNA binding protein